METNAGFRGRGRGRGFSSVHNRQSQSSLRDGPSSSVALVTDINERLSQLNLHSTITINLEFDEDTSTWFSYLKNYWNLLKKSPTVINMLHQRFNSSSNPYEHVLVLTYNCLDFKDAKPKTLAYLIMDEFSNWTKTLKFDISRQLTVQLKISAFNMVRQQRSFLLMKLVATVYEMAKDCDIFLECINCMIQDKKYKEASQCATLLGIQNKFSIEAFLVPLVLQDKLVCVDEFLLESPPHRIELVSFLDSMLNNQSSIRNVIDPLLTKLDVPEIKWNKIYAKPWRKLVARLVKMFKLPPEVTPNLNKRRNEGTLHFLLLKRYTDNCFGDESWKEMIREAVQDDVILQKDLVIEIAAFGDPAEALRWAHYYNVDRELWPYSVRLLSDNPDQDRYQQKPAVESWDNLDTNFPTAFIEYHKFKLGFECIHVVDDKATFEYFIYYGLEDVTVVGIDCEWKPSFGIIGNELSLLQLATRQSVFIMDVIKLGSILPMLWQKLNEVLFNNSNILKLGFNLSTDLSMIRQALPHMGTLQGIGFLDLMTLWKQIDKDPKVKLPYTARNGGLSLNTLVEHCCGQPLDKSDQFSNWENRPLRNSQLTYAALDAYCLIEVYDILKKCCEQNSFPFYDVCYMLMSSRQPKKKSKKHLDKQRTQKKEVPQAVSPHASIVPANSLKLVCDTMLQGLGKALRKCGIDTVVLATFDDHMQCVRLANDENRYILTRGVVYDQLTGYVPSGHCYKVISDDPEEQMKEIVDYYKIKVTKDDVFSRCQACNSNSFIKISQSTMSAVAVANEKSKLNAAYYQESLLADEATGFSSDEDYCDDTPPPPASISQSRKWDLCADENVDVGLCLTKQGAKIQVEDVPSPILQKIDLFYVCEHCGKVYWDGSHFNKALTGRLQGIVQS